MCAEPEITLMEGIIDQTDLSWQIGRVFHPHWPELDIDRFPFARGAVAFRSPG